MRVLDDDYKTITVDCSPRLNQLINRFYIIGQKIENTWFNKTLKERLNYHRDEISHQVRRHIRKQDNNVICSVEIKRIFGTIDKYTSKIIVKK